jgi:phage tail sheath protein FI
MPVQPTYPGVYVEEVPSGVRTITGVSTSVAAFIDYFSRGPMNKAVQLFSFADFEREFGGLDKKSEASYAIQQFFVNGGTEAWVVRTAAEDQTTAQPKKPQKASVEVSDKTGGSKALTVTALNEGKWGNDLLFTVDYDPDVSTSFNITVSSVKTINNHTVITGQERFSNVSMDDTDSNYVESVVEQQSRLIAVSKNATNRPLASGTLSESHANTDWSTLGEKRSIKVSFVVYDTPPPPPASPPAPVIVTKIVDLGEKIKFSSLEDAAARLQDAIRYANPTKPDWAETTVQVVGNYIQVIAGPAVPETIIKFDTTTGDSSTVAELKLKGANVTENVGWYVLGSTKQNIGAQGATETGTNGAPPDAKVLIGSQALDPPTGLYALDKVSVFNILCLPRIAKVTGKNGFEKSQVDAVISTALSYCEKRRTFLLIDTPSNVFNLPQMKKWLSDKASILRNKNAAVYFPRVKISDPLDQYRLRSFGASGTIAGLYSRTDATRGVWKSPAGIDGVLRNVSALEYVMTDDENGALNPLAINCLRNFPIYGNVSWGARTLDGSDQKASEWKYIPVRRFALFMEESLYRGLKWVVFEPNDEPLWSQIRLNAGAFMHNLFRQGAFQGQTPDKAYFVKCDSETTTQNDINLGIVNILVGFAPLKPAEFVILRLQQIAGQIQT